MLDLIVLVAMGVTAAAFAVGLMTQAGLPFVLSVITAAALYLIMASSYIMVSRARGGGADSARLDKLEGAIQNIDSDLQRIGRVEGGYARIEELASELERMHARVEDLCSGFEAETRSQREKISNDLGMLEGLIKQLSHDLTGAAAATAPAAGLTAAAATQTSEPEPVIEAPAASEGDETLTLSDAELDTVVAAVAEIIESGGTEEEAIVETETETTAEVLETAEGITIVETETITAETVVEASTPAPVSEPAVEAVTATPESVGGMLGTLHRAIEAGRVDLYLQPIVALPERKSRYYESLTRIRDAADDVILPGAYLPTAEEAGIMPLIDNVLLVKSVQVLRRRAPHSKLKGLFCNISIQSLLDPDFFPELVEFMEENSSLSEHLIFELRQPEIIGLSRNELGSLDTLGALGFSFSLDHIADLDIDFIGLSDRYFRFLKIDVQTFLHGLEEKGAPLPAGEMLRYLEGFGLQVVVNKVEDETAAARLVDLGVELAQGDLFGAPKPISPELSRELEDADAA